MNQISGDGRRFERPTEVLVREIGDEMVLLNTGSEQYHSLNDVGRRCYELLIGDATVGAAIETMCAEYDTTPDRVRDDLAALLPGLLDAGLLRIVE